jgi:hypothetical protein
MRNVAALLLAAAVSGSASAQQAAPTPPPQSAVVPSLPDQKNKETSVRPSGTLATDAAGWVKTGTDKADGGQKPPPNPAVATERVPPVRGAGAGGGFRPPPPAPAPSGPAVVGAAYVSVHGVVKAYRAGTSITVVEASGRERTVPLTENAGVYEGLKTGDKVVLRIPLGKPADGKSADTVEKEKPTKTPPKSKFAAAQTGGN